MLKLTWRDVFDAHKRFYGSLQMARFQAMSAGYKYLSYNGRVYHTVDGRDAGITDNEVGKAAEVEA